jgi:hypothetical protein
MHAFHDLPAECFPLRMRFFAAGDVVFDERVDGPGAIYIPPLAQEYGPVTCRIDFADGSYVEEGELHEP